MDQQLRGDLRAETRAASLDVSVVCPFYNEEAILGDAIRQLLARLEKLEVSWELIVVDDGSRDGSARVAAEIARENPRLRVLGYEFNRGRGHGLRTGIEQARGEIIVTTEIDLSWGEDIVERLVAAMQAHPDADIIVASPHLAGGGYKNVPTNRVFFSSAGNWIIRALMANAVTMNTGMTRAYRRDSIRSLPLDENGKEFHLEVILKGSSMGYRIEEIPAVLEWKQYKHHGERVSRKSSSKVNKLVLTHSLFSLFANPMRYTFALASVATVLSMAFLVGGGVRYAMGLVSVYMGIISIGLAIVALLLFAFGVLAQQGNMIQRELWRMKQEMWKLQHEDDEAHRLGIAAADAVSRDTGANGEL